MLSISTLTASPRHLVLALVALAAAILGAALVFEHLWGYAPCHLCLQQREPWWGLIGIGLTALYLPFGWRRIPGRVLIGLCALGVALALYNAGLGGYHAGIEWKWWKGPPECASTGADLTPGEGDLLSGVRPILCDEAAWRDPILMLSMAGYNVLASLLAAVITALAGWRLFQMSRVTAMLQPGLRTLNWKRTT
jgi:disulfide bond formation protein DsbB